MIGIIVLDQENCISYINNEVQIILKVVFIKDLFVEIKNFDEVELDQEILHLDSKVIFIHNY